MKNDVIEFKNLKVYFDAIKITDEDIYRQMINKYIYPYLNRTVKGDKDLIQIRILIDAIKEDYNLQSLIEAALLLSTLKIEDLKKYFKFERIEKENEYLFKIENITSFE